MGIDTLIARAVFVDRDGVINRNVFNTQTGAYESPMAPEDVALHDRVIPALLALQSAGYLLILVSNQPNCAKGKATMETLDTIHQRIFAPIQAAGVVFTEIHYCYHHPEGIVGGYTGVCECRKPSPKFLLDDQRRHGIDLARSWMVGDRDADMWCGIRAGTRTIRIRSDESAATAAAHAPSEFEVSDLFAAASTILEVDG